MGSFTFDDVEEFAKKVVVMFCLRIEMIDKISVHTWIESTLVFLQVFGHFAFLTLRSTHPWLKMLAFGPISFSSNCINDLRQMFPLSRGQKYRYNRNRINMVRGPMLTLAGAWGPPILFICYHSFIKVCHHHIFANLISALTMSNHFQTKMFFFMKNFNRLNDNKSLPLIL